MQDGLGVGRAGAEAVMSPRVAVASLAHGRRLVAAPRARTEWRRDLVVRSRTQITAVVWSWTGSVVQLAPRWLRVVAAATPVVRLKVKS